MSAPEQSVADLTQQLAALSRAGLSRNRVWATLADGPTGHGIAARVNDVMTLGGDPAEGLLAVAQPSSDLQLLAAACSAADRTGAPLADVLDAIAEVLRARRRAALQVDAALAGPRATAAVLSLLPVAGLVIGLLLGVNVPAVLIGAPVGRACLIAGGLAWALGWSWLRVMVARAIRGGRGPDTPPDLVAVLIAALVDAGLAPGPAEQAAAAALTSAGLPVPQLPASALTALELAERAGLGPGTLLRAAATAEQERRATAATSAAARLAVLAVLPAGLLLLPAFVLLTVVPLVLALFSGS